MRHHRAAPHHRLRRGRPRRRLFFRRVLAGHVADDDRAVRRSRPTADRLPAGGPRLRRARRDRRRRPAGRRQPDRASSRAAATSSSSCRWACQRHRVGHTSPRPRSRGGRTIVADVGIADGGGSTATVDGAWALPTIGYDPTPTGLSADGKTLVLVPAGDPDPTRATSSFAIVPFPPIDGAPKLAPRVVELPGALDYDAISPDGRILYVAEHLDGDGGYQVRAVDLPGGTMRAGPDRRQAQHRRDDGRLAGRPAPLAEWPGPDAVPRHRPPVHPRAPISRGMGRLHRPSGRR